MSDNAVNDMPNHLAKLLAPILVVAAIAVVIVLDPLGAIAGSIDFSWMSLPDMPGWLRFIGDLPGPGLLLVIVALVALGELGRRSRDDDGSAS
ncbi:MAG: hypothetical protein Q8O56_09755 [Solirubrobacteraceae bacterium]|nr:hypothetical protein [Solirubrobacteraceae bacterium]